MALHLFQPHSSKPSPPPSILKLTSLLGLRSSTAVHKLQHGTNGLNSLEIRAKPPPRSRLQILRSGTRPPRYRAVEDEVSPPKFVKSSKGSYSSKPDSDSVSLSSPPSSREEAIFQAKTCLAATLQKSLKSTVPFSTKKLKKQKQLRYRVEIPVIDDSPNSVVQLAFEVFSDLNINRKDSKPSMLLVWPSPTLEELANQTFSESPNAITNLKLGSITLDLLESADLAVVLAPEESQLEEISTVAEELYPKPVILFNPRWAFEDEKDFNRRVVTFLESFHVVYSFTGLEVQGILSSRRGVVMRCVRDGKAGGEPWLVMVQEGDRGEMKVVTRFTKRPSIVEVETVLYNLMAANSPLTKSIKSVSDFVRNVTKKFT
ncbi:hypothetical protein FCM35_KLT15291 [Carex littledalei]|uniref:DUF1995 domain-containing protein n=1 Tax=Carex littledalei TaxID=544730 RepID=A0A833VCN6_9POAL|nr:hypothetical protein FCM35_KLT15291 [Carex littledalei]